jgi:calreticulin
MKIAVLLCVLCGYLVNAETVYFKEEFDSTWRDRWVESKFKGAEQGSFGWTAGKFYNDAEKDKGLQTSQDAKFYGISAKFPKFSNEGKTLVVQFSVKHDQNIDCGGGYVKVFADDVEQENFHGETPYSIMFGPDICGMTKKVHVIFHYNGVNHLIKKEIRCKDDELTHLYTLILRPDNTYEVLIDLEKVESGTLEEDWDMLKPKKIKDPQAKKPEDWEDNEKIDDPSDSKPADWEKPKTIPDASAKKPEDWDDEMDGEWEPPQIDNPEYKGEWKPKQIDNPKYKGPWIHPEIDNPEYKADDNLYLFKNIGGIGFDLWQVKSGTIFDNIFITDDVDAAKKFGEETFKVTAEGEKKMKEAADEVERKRMEKEAEEQKAKDAEEKAKKPAEETETKETVEDEPKKEEKDEL